MATSKKSSSPTPIVQNKDSFNAEFKALVDNVQYAYMALTKCMAEGNNVYLEFCDHVMESALDVVEELYETEEEAISNLPAELDKLKKEVAEKISTQAKKAAKSANTAALSTKGKAITASKAKSTESIAIASMQTMQIAFANKFLLEMLGMMANLIHAQNQQMMLAESATTQGVAQIYSLDTIADAISISTMKTKKK